MSHRLRNIGIVLALLAGSLAWVKHSAKANEEAAVRAALQHYLLGHSTGDGTHFSAVFHPESKLFWVRDGQLIQRSSAEYIAGAPGKPAADEAQRARRIVSKLTDYMSLLKIAASGRS